MNSSNTNHLIDSSNIQKYLEQINKKKEYNRRYYHRKVKPQRLTEKQELEILREKCAQLETYISSFNDNHNKSTITSDNDIIIDLQQQILKYQQENQALTTLVEVTRQRNYELMMMHADDFLPNITNLTLNG